MEISWIFITKWCPLIFAFCASSLLLSSSDLMIIFLQSALNFFSSSFWFLVFAISSKVLIVFIKSLHSFSTFSFAFFLHNFNSSLMLFSLKPSIESPSCFSVSDYILLYIASSSPSRLIHDLKNLMALNQKSLFLIESPFNFEAGLFQLSNCSNGTWSVVECWTCVPWYSCFKIKETSL